MKYNAKEEVIFMHESRLALLAVVHLNPYAFQAMLL